MDTNIIADFKRQVMARDYKLALDHSCCMKCKHPVTDETAIVHRITDGLHIAYEGYSPLNGITLCDKCAKKADRYAETNAVGAVAGYYPFDLYTLIHSSYEAAHADCMARQAENG